MLSYALQVQHSLYGDDKIHEDSPLMNDKSFKSNPIIMLSVKLCVIKWLDLNIFSKNLLK